MEMGLCRGRGLVVTLSALLLMLLAFTRVAHAETAMVARVGEAEFSSLEAAINASESGDTVVLLNDANGDKQISISDNKNLTIDFSGYTYEVCDSVDSNSASSYFGFAVPGTSIVSFRNGTIKVSDDAERARGAITSRGSVSFDDVNVVGGDYMASPLIDLAAGSAVFSGATNITTQSPDAPAFYVKHWGASAPEKGVHVLFDESYEGAVSGTIAYYSSSADKATLRIQGNGHFYCVTEMSYSLVKPSISIYSGMFTLPVATTYLADGLDVVLTPDDLYKVVSIDKARKVVFDYGEDFDEETGKSLVEVKVENGSLIKERKLHAIYGYQVFWMLSDGSKYDFLAPVTGDMTLTASKILLPIEVEVEAIQTSLISGDTAHIYVFPYSEAAGITYAYAWYKNGVLMDVDSDASDIEVEEEGVYGVIVTATDREGNTATSKLVEINVTSVGARMHRLYNSYTGEHFYTASAEECDGLVAVGWTDEGLGWIAPTSGDPVYRLYNPYVAGGDHHYTLSWDEVETLREAGWEYEGVGWRSAPAATGVPLYRQYNPFAKTGTHNYTTSKEERDHLVSVGWRDEGIAWYGVGESAVDPAPDSVPDPTPDLDFNLSHGSYEVVMEVDSTYPLAVHGEVNRLPMPAASLISGPSATSTAARATISTLSPLSGPAAVISSSITRTTTRNLRFPSGSFPQDLANSSRSRSCGRPAPTTPCGVSAGATTRTLC
ncbi:hypothetical protein [Olsenella sp. SW781]|uniref:hypothetical protein n=1 Tax=Olsenella sp. SW781 TaxID=2530046 RepID=UPI0019809B81|nr:hypothetical protein [Olsenella sp. SW781]